MAQRQYRSHPSALARATVEAGETALGSRAALAAWVGINRSQVTRAAGGQELSGEPGWRLAALASVVTALLTIYEPVAAAGWLHGSNPHLNDRRPLDVLAQGDLAGVMAAVQAARTGVYA